MWNAVWDYHMGGKENIWGHIRHTDSGTVGNKKKKTGLIKCAVRRYTICFSIQHFGGAKYRVDVEYDVASMKVQSC